MILLRWNAKLGMHARSYLNAFNTKKMQALTVHRYIFGGFTDCSKVYFRQQNGVWPGLRICAATVILSPFGFWFEPSKDLFFHTSKFKIPNLWFHNFSKCPRRMVHCPAVFLNTFAAENLSKFRWHRGMSSTDRKRSCGWVETAKKQRPIKTHSSNGKDLLASRFDYIYIYIFIHIHIVSIYLICVMNSNDNDSNRN